MVYIGKLFITPFKLCEGLNPLLWAFGPSKGGGWGEANKYKYRQRNRYFVSLYEYDMNVTN